MMLDLMIHDFDCVRWVAGDGLRQDMQRPLYNYWGSDANQAMVEDFIAAEARCHWHRT